MLAKTALTAGAVVVAGVCAFLCIAVDDLSGDGAGGAKKRKSAAAAADATIRRDGVSAGAADAAALNSVSDLYADDRSVASSVAQAAAGVYARHQRRSGSGSKQRDRD